MLDGLEPDIEGLVVNRLSDPPVYVIAPIDRCYALTGAVKATWEGISGGSRSRRRGDAILRGAPSGRPALAGRDEPAVSLHEGAANGGGPALALPEPEFAVIGARSVRYAAAPMLSLDLQVSERGGRSPCT